MRGQERDNWSCSAEATLSRPPNIDRVNTNCSQRQARHRMFDYRVQAMPGDEVWAGEQKNYVANPEGHGQLTPSYAARLHGPHRQHRGFRLSAAARPCRKRPLLPPGTNTFKKDYHASGK